MKVNIQKLRAAPPHHHTQPNPPQQEQTQQNQDDPFAQVDSEFGVSGFAALAKASENGASFMSNRKDAIDLLEKLEVDPKIELPTNTVECVIISLKHLHQSQVSN